MLSCAYIFPDPCTLRPPDRFRARFIYIFTWHGGSYCIDCRDRNRFFFFLQSTGLQSSLTWIERYGDERIGCTETIAEGERFLAWGWTCSPNALQDRYRASLGRGEVANNIWVSISFLSNRCFPSEGLYEPSETKSVKHKVPAMQLHYAFHRQCLVYRCQKWFCFNRKSLKLLTIRPVPAQYQPSHQRETTSTLSQCVLVAACHCLSQHFFITLTVKANYEHTHE